MSAFQRVIIGMESVCGMSIFSANFVLYLGFIRNESMSVVVTFPSGVPSRSKSLQEVASQPPAWLDSGSAKQKLREALNQAQSSSRLNTSQARAIKEALQRTMTLIQGYAQLTNRYQEVRKRLRN